MTKPYLGRKPKRPKPKYVKLYPVLPYLPRRDRFAWDVGGHSYTSKTILVHRSMYCETTNVLGGVTVSVNDQTETGYGVNSAKSFQRNKDWKQLVVKGQNATYPYSRSDGSAKLVRYNGTATNLASKDRHKFYGSLPGNPCVVENDNTDLKDLALTRLKRKLNGYVGQAQLAAPLAESREICRLVKQINGLGLEALKALLLLKRTHGKSGLKLFGNIWLGFGFGVNPLLKDIEAAANSILDYQTRTDRSVRVSASASRDYHSVGLASPPVNIATNVATQIVGQAAHKQGVRIVAGIDINIKSDASYSVVDHLGLGIYDIPSAIWELVPYSWAVDYFTTVSPWLDDTFYTLPGTLKYCCQTEKYQNDVVWTLVRTDNPSFAGQNPAQIACQPGGSRYFTFTRSSLATLPTRQLKVKNLDSVAMYGVTKLLNLASVLAGHLATPNV